MEIAGVIFLALFILAFGAFLILLAASIGKSFPKIAQNEKVKFASYECGIEVQEKHDTKISIKFYLTAILFIIFDIEIIFMYPWAIQLRNFVQEGLGAQALVAMGIFLFVFIFGLFWEVKSKALEWE